MVCGLTTISVVYRDCPGICCLTYVSRGDLKSQISGLDIRPFPAKNIANSG
jgi:hypothetical protein